VAITGFVLTIAGVPYVLGTDGVGTMPTSTSPLWWGAEAGVVLVRGALAAQGLRWSERAKPLAGELEVDSMTFTLRDPVVSTGIAAGEHLLTWLATRNSVNVASTPLAATIDDNDASATVGNGATLTAGTWAWLNREAMYVSGIVGNVISIDRGKLGTRAVAHLVDNTLAPEVFAAVPWVQRRKVVLWVVEDGVATPAWMGFCVRAPSLSGDGSTYSLACDPYLQVIADAPIGSSAEVARLVGYGEGARQGPAWGVNVLGIRTQVVLEVDAVGSSFNSVRTWEELAAGVMQRLETASTNRGTRLSPFISRVGTRGRVDIDRAGSFFAGVWWAGEAATPELVPSRARSGSRDFVSLEFGPIPEVLYCFVDQSSVQLAVSSLGNLPSSWSSTSYDLSTDHVTQVERGLRVELSRDWWVDFTFISVGAASALSPWLEAVSCTTVPRKWGLTPYGATDVLKLASPGPLAAMHRVTTGHWAWGLRRAALPLVDDAMSETDWDWSTLGDVVAATIGHAVARAWTFDGRRTTGDLLRECCLLSGVTPVVRSGRPALHAWSWPRVGVAPDAVLTALTILGTPQWSTWDDGLANRISLKSDALQINIVDQGSIARYGPGHEIAVSLAGVDQQGPLTDDPYTLARQALGRLSLWADPLPSVKVQTSIAHHRVELGDLVTAADWITPDGAGGRGLAGARGIVYGREVDYDDARVTLDILLFPRVSYGYAPCARVLSVVTSTVVDIDATPIGPVDYAGGTDGLGGTGTGVQTLFAVGNRVQLLTRDAATLTAEDRIIDTILWTGTEWRIGFTAALSAGMQTAIGAGPVDIRGSEYATAGIQAAQREYMHVADDSTLVIDGTADRARVIAP
jgi:hypothetical protein